MAMQTATSNKKTAPVNTASGPAVQAAQQAPAKRGRMKKDDAPFTINFVNDKGESSSRVPTIVSGIQIVGFDKKAKTYPIDGIPSTAILQLAADSLRRKFNGYLGDITKANIGSLFASSDEFYSSAKNGNIFVAKEGGGPGRTIDFDYWIAVVERVAKLQVEQKIPKARLMSDKDKEDFKVMFGAWTNKEREEKKAAWRKNAVFKKAELQIKLERQDAEEAKDAELFSAL